MINIAIFDIGCSVWAAFRQRAYIDRNANISDEMLEVHVNI